MLSVYNDLQRPFTREWVQVFVSNNSTGGGRGSKLEPPTLQSKGYTTYEAVYYIQTHTTHTAVEGDSGLI